MHFRLRRDMSGRRICREALRFELGERGAKPAHIASARMAVDQSSELSHGAPRIGQVDLVELDQSQADTEIILVAEGYPTAEIVELERGGLGAGERLGQQFCPA